MWKCNHFDKSRLLIPVWIMLKGTLIKHFAERNKQEEVAKNQSNVMKHNMKKVIGVYLLQIAQSGY